MNQYGEPWNQLITSQSEIEILSKNPDGVHADHIASVSDNESAASSMHEIADRIIACVNFLEGVPTECLASTLKDRVLDAFERIVNDLCNGDQK